MNQAQRANLHAKLGPDAFARIQACRVGIAGAGGLGSNCAAHLVRSGFRRLTIVDFDNVEYSNLDRQWYFGDQVGRLKIAALCDNLKRINPDLELNLLPVRITAALVVELFADCDIVAECLDDAETKRMLVEKLLELGKHVVTVSGIGGVGNSDAIRVHAIRPGLILIGDLISDIATAPALAPRVAIAAAKQADMILEQTLSLRVMG